MKKYIGLILISLLILTLSGQDIELNLLNPNGGEVWTAGGTGYYFFYISTGGILAVSLVKGPELQTIFTKPNIVIHGSGYYSGYLPLPDTLAAGNDYKLRLCSSGVSDSSDGYFSIVNTTGNEEDIGYTQSNSAISVYPNPFTSELSVDLKLTQTSLVKLDIYDLRGRRLLSMPVVQKSAGQSTLSWDGRDILHKRVPDGIYLVQVQTGGVSNTVKCLKISKPLRDY